MIKLTQREKALVSTRLTKEERDSLSAHFNRYFRGDYSWDEVTAHKARAYDGHYVILQVTPRGDPARRFYADFARGGQNGPWQCQNDAEEMSDAEWALLYIPEQTDGYVVKGRGD